MLPGFLPSLLALITHKGANRDVKQTAAHALQNAVKRYWPNTPRERSPFSDADKAFVRGNIVAVVLGAEVHSVMAFGIETIAHIVLEDFPDRWQEFPAQLVEALKQPDIGVVFRAAKILRRVSKMYQYASSASGERAPWEMLIQATFPQLAVIMKQCITSNALDAANVMRMILKCYWGGFNRCLTGYLAQLPVLTEWMDLVNTLLGKYLPEASEGKEPAGQPTDPHDRYNWPWWKVKKWCACIMDRMMNRYGTPAWTTEGTDTEAAAKLFHDTFAPQVLSTVWGNIQLRLQGRYCTDRVFVHCLSYVKVGLEFGSCWSQLEGSKGVLLQDVIIATLKYNAADVSLWTEDPDEFIRTYYSTLDDYFDPRVEVKNLLWYLVAARGKAFMPYLQSTFEAFLQQYAAQAPESRDWTVKEAVLACLESISAKFLENQAYRGGVPAMLASYVIPELQSPIGPMRARAASVIGKYVGAAFDAASWKAIVTQIISMMKDSEAVVQYVAAATFNALLRNVTTADIMRPMVMEILNTLFQLVARFKADEIVSALAAVFTTFPEECNPQGPAVVAKLCEFFTQFSYAAANTKDDDGDHLEFAALNCLGGIRAVMDHTQYTPERMASFISSAGTLAVRLMDKESDLVHWDYIQGAMDFIYSIAFNTPKGGFTADHWALFEHACFATLSYGSDFADVFASTTDPFIVKDVDTLLTRKAGSVVPSFAGRTMVQLLFDVHKHMVKTQSEDEMVYTSRPLCSTLLSATGGRADALIPDILDHTAQLICDLGHGVKAKTSALRIAGASAMAAAMMNNPTLVASWMESKQVALPVLEAFVYSTTEGLSSLDKKMAAAGLVSLASVLPASSALLPQVLATAGLLAYQEENGLTGAMVDDDGDEESDEEEASGTDDGAIAASGDDSGPVVIGEVDLADTDSVDHTMDQKIHDAIEAMPMDAGLGIWDVGVSEERMAANTGTTVISELDLPKAFFGIMSQAHVKPLVPSIMGMLPDDETRVGVNKVFTKGEASASGISTGAGV